jgi:hypothetical protein
MILEKKIFGVQISKSKISRIERIIGCKHPIIASGLLASGALIAHPIEKSSGNIILLWE